MQNKYDVIVMGGGIGGLTIACRLSFSRKVIVFEKNSVLGGYCSTFERSGYKFESAIHAINNCESGSFIHNILEECGVINELEFIRPPNLYRAVYPGHDIVFPQKNLNRCLEILKNHFPDEKEGIDAIFAEIRKIHTEVEHINREKKLLRSPAIVKATETSWQYLLDKYLVSPELKSIISQYWVYCGLPPSRLSPVHFSYIARDYMMNGAYCIKGGVQTLIDVLEKRIIKNEGLIIKRCEVADIVVEDGKAVGIITANGDRYYADQLISSMDARYTFEHLTEKSEDVNICLKQMRETEPSISCVRIYLGLNRDCREMGIDDYEVFINAGYDIDKAFDAAVKNDISNATFGLCIHSNVDRTMCKDGHSVVAITMLAGYDYWKALDRNGYKEEKMKIANALIAKSERIIPNLRKYIDVMVITTPLTMERYTGNIGGAAYGWSRNVFFYGSRHMNIETPVKNLYLSSNWTKIGGGVEGVIRSANRTYDLIMGIA